MKKETCPRCKSENVTMSDCTDEETGEVIGTLLDGKCNNCGFEYIITYLDDI